MSATKGDNLIETWKKYICKHLGRSVGRKYISIISDITAVDSGVKPGYLFDIGQPDPIKLSELLQDLKSARLITSFCNVMQVGLDCIVVNVDSVKAMDVTAESLEETLVDVTHGRGSPGLCEDRLASVKLYNAFKEIKDNLDAQRIHVHSLNDPVCNVSSLFGLLLGYPVLYWYDTSDDGYQGNCLSMETLRCVKLFVKFTANKSINTMTVQNMNVNHCLYSFSYPASMLGFFKTSIDRWFSNVNNLVEHSQVFSEPKMVQEEAVFETLNL